MSGNPVFVKLCGLRDVTSARVAVEAGADALGFILAPSKRRVRPEEIREIKQQLVREFDDTPQMVGIIVNETPETISHLARESGVDKVQLSGDESPDILGEIDVPVIKALRFPAGTPPDEARREVERWLNAPGSPRYLIVEGHAHGSYGGTGIRADWELVREIAEHYPVILAGGLNPDNVSEAVDTVGPFGVDVSSGTETNGVKDPAKIRSFVVNARTPGSRARKLT